MPSTFGQRVMRNAAKRREEAEKAKAAAKEAERARLAEREAERAASSSRRGLGSGGGGRAESVGDFEKHTKGIGMKLLQKMGYKKGGGLGKDGKGMSTPMQTQMRPVGMGMGYGDFKEAGQLNNRREGAAERVDRREESETPRASAATDRAAAGAREERRKQEANERAMWKRRDELRRARREYRTAEEVLAEQERADRAAAENGGSAAPPPMTIVDMRGGSARVVTDLSKLETASSDLNSEELPFPELQHNLRLVVDLAEAEIQTADAKIRHEKDTRELLERERARLRENLEDATSAATSVSTLLRDAEACEAAARNGTASFSDLAESHARMAESHHEAYAAHGLRDLALSHARPGLSRLIGEDWNPLADPKPEIAKATRAWRRCLTVPGPPREVRRVDAFAGPAGGPIDLIATLVAEPVAHPIRAALVTKWDPRDPEPALRVLETWDGTLPRAVVEELHASAVLPKLRRAVDEWEPALVSATPAHVWLHPWLPRLGESLQSLWAPIRHKLGAALAEWHPSDDSALRLLGPWRRVFEPRDWDALLSRAVTPKLEHALLAELVVDRDAGADAAALAASPKAAPLGWVTRWERCLPAKKMVGLLEACFFPKWHRTLHGWLARRPGTEQPPLDLEQVTRWYLGWKSLFSEDLLAHERVRAQINVALDMMNQAAAGDGVSAPPVAADEARRAAKAARGAARAEAKSQKAPSRVPPAEREMDDDELCASMTLREAVEAFAVSRDVRFAPKPGREGPAGLRVWSFGAISVTIDAAKQMLRARVDGRWAPVSLDQLLELHEKKERKP